MTVVGVDISSRRIDLAWLDEDGYPMRWHQQLDPKAHLIDRLRQIRIEWPRWTGDPGSNGSDTSEIAIEYPYGRSRATVAALCAVAGIVTRQAPPWARVAWPSAQEVRAAIGARNNKTDAHQRIKQIYPGGCTILNGTTVIGNGTFEWDEHELDALVTCIGWTKILSAQDAQ